MKTRNYLLILLAALFPITADSSAEVQGGSNLGASGYPSHSCTRPTAKKPSGPTLFKNEAELDAYNHSVDVYNAEAKPYMDCMQNYINSSYKDMERIKEKAQSALDEATRQ